MILGNTRAEQQGAEEENMERRIAYLSRARMKHPDVLGRYNMHSLRLDIPDLDKVWLERQDPGIGEREALWQALPVDPPVRSCAPAIAVDEERELRVVEQELAVETLDVDGANVLLPRDEVERRVGLVEERLRLQGLERDDFEATSAGDAELRLKEVDGRGFSRDVEFLEGLELVLVAAIEHLEALLFLAL